MVRALLSWLALAAPPAAEGPVPPPEPSPAPQAEKAPRLGFDPAAAPRKAGTTPADLGLVRDEAGGYVYVDPGRRFTATFSPDGTVQFADRWRRPDPTRAQTGRCCALPAEGFSAVNPLAGIGMSGPIEWLMAIQGHDPSAAAKDALLNRTRDLRTKMAVAFTLSLLESRLRELQPELLAIWSDPSLSDARRRELLFERWDECDERFAVEPGEVPAEARSEIDRARLDTAERARRRIEAFVRRHAPARSRRAYAQAELEALNRRRVSQTAFSPYTGRDR